MPSKEQMCFYDPNFLALNPLTKHNILDYFATSHFYQKDSLNEILKMQSQFSQFDFEDKLSNTVGFYYKVAERDNSTDDSLFTILRIENNGRESVTTAAYYSLVGYIYSAPSYESVSDCITMDTLWCLNEAVDDYLTVAEKEWTFGEQDREENAQPKEENMRLFKEALYDFERSTKNKQNK
ncbi:mediator of RNA polymerase II transcription subunit 6 [Enteropsectra breve]|nr:mediator of RNA polymerase II transcription subunit 6 [Enteropsectra breve]